MVKYQERTRSSLSNFSPTRECLSYHFGIGEQVKIILAYLRRVGVEAVLTGKPKFDGPDVVHTIRLRNGLAAEVS